MRRLVAWIGGTVGGITAYRLLRRRRAADVAPELEVVPEPDARADELRAKLDESRTAEPEWMALPPRQPVAGEPTADDPETAESAEPESPEERRRRVHEEGRTALDDMQSE